MKTPVTRLALFLLLGMAGAASPILAQLGDEGEKVAVRGAAPIQGGIPASRERALQQAFRMAVEQVAGVMLESETLVENMALFEDNILTRTEGYVRSYDVIHEGAEDDIYVVDLEVFVVPGQLSRDLQSLGILLKRADYPTVSVELFATSVTELPPETSARFEAETRALLEDRGLEVIRPNRSGLEPNVRIEATLELTDQGDAAGLGLESARATLAIEAIEEATGVIMASGRERSRGAGISPEAARDQAAVRALDAGVDELVDGLVEAWSSRVNNSDAVLISLRGVASLAQVEWLAEQMEADFGETRDVSSRQVDVTRGSAVLQWRGRSDARSLANWLDRQGFQEHRIIVLGVAGNLIQIEFLAPTRGTPFPFLKE